jgi:hypothetical protein
MTCHATTRKRHHADTDRGIRAGDGAASSECQWTSTMASEDRSRRVEARFLDPYVELSKSASECARAITFGGRYE